MLLGLVVVAVAASCGGASGRAQSSKNGFNPPAPTPSTPNPADEIQSFDDAIAKATNEFTAQTGDPARASHVQSLAYVQTTARQALTLVSAWSDAALPLANNKAWLFVERGTFQHVGFKNATPGPIAHTLWVVMIQGYTLPLSSLSGAGEPPPIDLSQLGAPVVVPPGRIPAVDALRGPMALQVGAPTLAAGKLQVPLSAANPYEATLVPYTAVRLHLRWDPAVFAYSGFSAAGSVLPSPSCLSVVSRDADGGGVVLGCASAGAQTAATGLLATVLLTPKGSGCSRLHLVTYGQQDRGDATDGTYALNAFSDQPLPAQYGDASGGTGGAPC